MRTKAKTSSVKILTHKGTKRRVVWRKDRVQYAIVCDSLPEAQLCAAQVKLALVEAAPWPPELLTKPAVQRYIKTKSVSLKPGQSIIDVYLKVIAGDVTHGWLKTSEAYLRGFEKQFGDLSEVSDITAQKYISEIGLKQSVETRNKKLMCLKKFYKWACQTHYWPNNPFKDIKKTRAVKVNKEIHYLTRDEREKVLEVAGKYKYGLAVWVAVYTGMRCGEVFGLRWEDINFESETVVAQSKKGNVRTIPLAKPLLERLAAIPRGKGLVFSSGSYKGSQRALVKTLRTHCKEIDPDCIGWNPFRHTFCSLLVQSGVSLDKIAMWAGHSIDVCKRYYARFIPKDKKDKDIDLL